MIEFPTLDALSPEAEFSADAALRGVLPPARRDNIPGHVWVEAAGRAERLRFYGAAIGGSPIIFLEGDIFLRRDDGEVHWTVGEGYDEIAPRQIQAEAEQCAIAIGRTFLNLARPGTYGSSGNHHERRREREVALVDCALDQLKIAFGWQSINLAGLSGGGHLVAALMARRGDIDCAVIASGNVAVRMRNQERGIRVDVTGYSDFVDPIDLVSDVAQHPPNKVIVLTDPRDEIVSALVQTAYVQALRSVGVAVEHRFLPATDAHHHILRQAAILAAATYSAQGM
jgi:dienelactone hydrolase